MTIFLRRNCPVSEVKLCMDKYNFLILYNIYSVCFEFHINTLIVFEAVFIRYEVLCHCERKSGDPKRYFCTFGEKAHTNKRVSIIA